jgi:hypothetical protein
MAYPPLLALAALLGAASAETPREAKKVCRPAAPVVGSHIKRARICRTAAEWAEHDAARRAPDITTHAAQPEPWERTRPQ